MPHEKIMSGSYVYLSNLHSAVCGKMSSSTCSIQSFCPEIVRANPDESLTVSNLSDGELIKYYN